MISATRKNSDFVKPALHELAFQNWIIPAAILTGGGILREVNLAFLNLTGAAADDIDHEARLSDFMLSSERAELNDWLSSSKTAAGNSEWLDTVMLVRDGAEKRVGIVLQELPNSSRWLACLFDKAKWNIKNGLMRTDELANLFMLVSHNLKSPIVSILGFTKLISENLTELGQGELRSFLERIERNATRLEKMVRDIIGFSRLADRSRACQEVSLREVVENALLEFNYQIKALQMAVQVADNLPIVMGERENLGAVFSNLIDNAIKYRGAARQPLIEIGWEEKPAYHVFWVKDNGMGVPQTFLEKVFLPFERGAAPNEIEGTGLGLAIVKRIVEQHGGVVRMRSQPGAGTTISFTLPRSDCPGHGR